MSSSLDEVTPSTLLYLFADRVAPKDKALTEGIEVPCRGVKVQKRPLAAEMFAAAFVSLRDQGLVSLEVQQKKVLFVKTKKVLVTRTGQGDRPGLEGAVLAGLGGAGPKTVNDVIRTWLDEDVVGPWDNVIAEAAAEATEAGCFAETEVERGRLARKLLGSTAMRPSCERIEQFAPAFEGFYTRWQQFKSSEADLASELIDECGDAIKSREESADDDDRFD